MNRWTKQDHIKAAFIACPKPCIGGRMMWGWPEPQWRTELGLVGSCTHCGIEAFTADILNEVVVTQPAKQQRRSTGPHRRSGVGTGGWTGNHDIFAA